MLGHAGALAFRLAMPEHAVTFKAVTPEQSFVSVRLEEVAGVEGSRECTLVLDGSRWAAHVRAQGSTTAPVVVARYQTHVGGVAAAPLRLRAFWKHEPGASHVKLEYAYNTRLGAPLRDVEVVVPGPGADKCQSKPAGAWADNNLTWTLPEIDANTVPGGLGILHAKWAGAGVAGPVPVACRLRCPDVTLSGASLAAVAASSVRIFYPPVVVLMVTLTHSCLALLFRSRTRRWTWSRCFRALRVPSIRSSWRSSDLSMFVEIL